MDLTALRHELQRRTLSIRYPAKLAAYLRPKLNYYDFTIGIPSNEDTALTVYKPWSAVLVQDLEYIREFQTLWRRYVENSTS